MIALATAAATPRDVAKVIVEQGVAALGGGVGALWLVADGDLVLEHWVGVEPGRRFRRAPLGGDTPLALAVRTSSPVWITSRAAYVAAFPQSGQQTLPVPDSPDDELACACLPLVTAHGPIGALMFAFRAARNFSEDERTFLVTIASQCAHAMERLRLLEHVRTLYEAEAEARREAEAASRAKDEFLALLGHELRNPLAPITTALAVMKLRPLADHSRERDVIERQVGHLVRLVDDLLDISRIARRRVELVRAPVPLAVAVQQAVDAVASTIESRRLAVELDVASDLIVDADHHRLAQVITNLLVNATKYTQPGGHIELRCSRDGEFACLRVRDDGAGIEPSVLGSVFDMFVQGERTNHGDPGLGLGLAIVKNLVEGHGGRVEAASEGPHTGATFTVWWPLARTEVEAAASSRAASADERARRVLVVDDNIDAAETMGELLRALGHDPIVVHDAPSALEIARGEPLEMALVDLGLPVVDGFELLARLRGMPGMAALRAVAVTGYGQDGDRQRTHAAGFDRHLVKPVGLEDLRMLLASL